MDIKEKSIRYADLWLKEPEEHDFPAALDYLELLFEPEAAEGLVTQLKQAKTIQKKSKRPFPGQQASIAFQG
ncbi:hypothetical protein [uncultured Chryseobacterium sp.]|uniref:hypothetical protein n=1 Tax=uncultured Chryseobacterium sp. TaxID=259322 RepID=UPI0025DE2D96|nr:hypothetical protein [uncultured Chryseobacterium sp.]